MRSNLFRAKVLIDCSLKNNCLHRNVCTTHIISHQLSHTNLSSKFQGTEVVVLVPSPSLAFGSSVVSGVVGNYRYVLLVLPFTAVEVPLRFFLWGYNLHTLCASANRWNLESPLPLATLWD